MSAAKQAFLLWSNVPLGKRSKIFFRFLRLLEDDIETFAHLVSEEHGKTLADAKGSIARGLEVLEFCCGLTSHLKSEFSASVAAGIDVYNLRQPLGVCAGITPFNFPAMVPMWMYPIAIACGNSFVLKPSEKVPSAAIYQAEKLQQAGLPDGVLNIVLGDGETVDHILAHPDIAAVSFVGSTAIGEKIYHSSALNNKRVQALCGAKNHLVVMPDADLNKVSAALMGSAYGSAGERCMAISVAVAVGDEVADKLLAILKPRIEQLKIGAYNQAEVEMGPLISQQSVTRIRQLIARGVKAGAKLVVDGRQVKVKGFEDGFFLGGCLFDQVQADMEIYQQEIFGPVLCVLRVDSYEQALALVNGHEYGNGASLFTNDGRYGRHFVQNVTAGMVGINVPIPVPASFYSFGGWKRSIFGANAIYGPEGVRFYTKLKTVTSRWLTDDNRGSQFNFQPSSES